MNTTKSLAAAALTVALTGAFVAGCSSSTEDGVDSTPSSSPRPSASTSPTAAEPPASAPPESPSGSPSAAASEPAQPMDTRRKFAEHTTRGRMVLQEVRIAGHPTYDRIVLEFSGKGQPGWSAQYVKAPRAEGSGLRLPVVGDSYLDVYASGSTYPTGPYYDGPRLIEPSDTSVIRSAYVAGVFEGYDQVILGINGPKAPFRVFSLTNPPRLVVDVGH